jgi:hypothetical protein
VRFVRAITPAFKLTLVGRINSEHPAAGSPKGPLRRANGRLAIAKCVLQGDDVSTPHELEPADDVVRGHSVRDRSCASEQPRLS